MKLYWANAKTADLEILSTYNGCMTYESALSQFGIWAEYGYRLKEMWITEYEDGVKIREIKVGVERQAIWITRELSSMMTS